MSIVKFEAPEFLQNVSADTIMQNMTQNLPLDIDKTEGGLVWDLLKPTALEKAELLQFYLLRTIKMMFHMYAEGEELDKHARANGLARKEANKSYGVVTVTGTKGLIIPAGFVFAVPADGDAAAIEFEALAETTIDETGIVDVEVQAVESGPSSNVDADTITIMRSPIRGITNVTNHESVTGGTEKEADDSLRQRIDDLLAGRGDSFVGNNADYVRWAQEVPGVGFAHTIPEYNGPNSVKVVVVDANGDPANNQILNNVLVHIFGTDRKDINRLAPVGLIDFTVVAPDPVEVNYKFKVKLIAGYTAEDIKEQFKKALGKYYAEVATIGGGTGATLKFYRLAATLVNVEGVDDIEDFTVNGAEANVAFHEDEFPVTNKIEVTVYG